MAETHTICSLHCMDGFTWEPQDDWIRWSK